MVVVFSALINNILSHFIILQYDVVSLLSNNNLELTFIITFDADYISGVRLEFRIILVYN